MRVCILELHRIIAFIVRNQWLMILVSATGHHPDCEVGIFRLRVRKGNKLCGWTLLFTKRSIYKIRCKSFIS